MRGGRIRRQGRRIHLRRGRIRRDDPSAPPPAPLTAARCCSALDTEGPDPLPGETDPPPAWPDPPRQPPGAASRAADRRSRAAPVSPPLASSRRGEGPATAVLVAGRLCRRAARAVARQRGGEGRRRRRRMRRRPCRPWDGSDADGSDGK
ncbi:hypothetical protein DAI22_04g131100 [Oryza sativa Japonica Group]|nr:hypothetical protein DAI22_04g131100 [Oryza sativa Japonica Group]